MVQEINSIEEFDEIVNNDQHVLIYMGAAWCHPCKQLSPIIDKLADKYVEKLSTYKVDIDANPDITTRYNIRSVPTVYLFRDSEIVGKIIGLKNIGEYTGMIDRSIN